MQYRIWTNGKYYKLQRRHWFSWKWLDNTRSWCNMWGKEHPEIFHSREELRDFIAKEEDWRIAQEILI